MQIFLLQLNLCAPLFLLVFVGWGLRKIGLFGDDVSTSLTGFAFRFLIPVLLFHMLSDLSNMPPVDWRVLLGFFGSCGILYVAGSIFHRRVFRATTAGATVLAMAGIFGNNVQLGLPILQLAFGPEAMPTASLIIIFNVLILWTIAIATVEFGAARAEKNASKNLAGMLKPMLRVLKNPVVIGILAGTAWGLTGLKLPHFAEETVQLISTATTPICLIAVGMGLAKCSFLGALGKNAFITIVKLGLQPALVYALCRLLQIDSYTSAVAAVMAGLPVAVNIYLMSADFRAEEDAASSAILLSTLTSAFTVPIALTLLGIGA